MKIYGPYTRKKDKYVHIIIAHDDGHRQTMSYHRYLWEQEYGPLEKEYDIHHKDRDPRNNFIENLEQKESIIHKREHASTGITMIEITCVRCGKKILKRKSNVDHNKTLGKCGPFCSRFCAGKWSMGY